MDNRINKLNERLNFYINAYDETSDDLKSLKKEITKVNKEITTESKNILDETVPNPLDDYQIDSLEKEFQMNLDDIVAKHEGIKEGYIKKADSLRADNRYKEYLNLLINDDLKICTEMEQDEVFNYLIDENFNTPKFRNEPYFEFWKVKYQPRFWKFKKIADKKAKEFGLPTFDEMFNLWNGLRINYKSLIGNKKITQVIKECEEIEVEIKRLDDSAENYLAERRESIINAIVERIKIISTSILDNYKFSNLIPLLESIKEMSEREVSLQERKSVIMENVNTVEKMISLAEQGRINLNDKKYDSFFTNTSPEKPIFELIDETEWKDIKRALEEKGIKTKSKENYSVVRTKVTQKEKEDLLKKFNVKEGEIFYDPALANKKY